MERARPRHPAARPGHHRRPGLDHRRRRLRPGRRQRLARAHARPRRATTCSPSSWSPPTAQRVPRERRREPRPVLGPARRRRQLRRRHRAHPELHQLARSFSVGLLLYRPEAGPEVVRAYRDFIDGAPGRGGRRRASTSPARPRSSCRRTWSARVLCGVAADVRGRARRTAQAGRAAAGAAAPRSEIVGADAVRRRSSACSTTRRACGTTGPRSTSTGAAGRGRRRRSAHARHAMPVPPVTQHVAVPAGRRVADGPADATRCRTATRRGSCTPSGSGRTRPTTSAASQWVAGRARRRRSRGRTGAVYLNFIGDEGADRVVAGFGAENTRRLAAVKAEYDPDNVFRFNHNIARLTPADARPAPGACSRIAAARVASAHRTAGSVPRGQCRHPGRRNHRAAGAGAARAAQRAAGGPRRAPTGWAGPCAGCTRARCRTSPPCSRAASCC